MNAGGEPRHTVGPHALEDRGECLWYVGDDGPDERHQYGVACWVVSRQTRFQQVGIIDSRIYGRILFLDGTLQSAGLDEYIYHESLVHPAMLTHPRPRRVLIVGGGEGASLREVLKHRSVEQVTMVDIDGELVSLCREHLPAWSAGAFDDPRVRLFIADGLTWVAESQETFDVVILDLTDQIDLGPSFPLYTRDFYETLKKRLAPGGLLVVQTGEFSVREFLSHCSVRQTLTASFDHVRSYIQHVPSFFSTWSFVLASDGPLLEQTSAAALDEAISRRIRGTTRFYDARIHEKMFTLPKDLCALEATRGTVVTDEASFERACLAEKEARGAE